MCITRYSLTWLSEDALVVLLEVWRTSLRSWSFCSTGLWWVCCRFLIPSSSASTRPMRARLCGSAHTCGASSTYGESCALPPSTGQCGSYTQNYTLHRMSNKWIVLYLLLGLDQCDVLYVFVEMLKHDKSCFFSCFSNADPPVWYDTDVKLFEIQRI